MGAPANCGRIEGAENFMVRPFASKRVSCGRTNPRHARHRRRLQIERLESRSLLSVVAWEGEADDLSPEVTSVDVPGGAVSSIGVVFSEPVNASALIEGESITQAVRLLDYRTGPLPLTAAQFTYNAAAAALTVSLESPLSAGRYELRLDGSRFQDDAGNRLLGGRGGLPADLPVWRAPELVPAGATELQVTKYSVPSLADWDRDGLKDLIVGEQLESGEGKIRVYLNHGTHDAPVFSSSSYARLSAGADLVVPGSGCLGVFPRVFDWDADGRQDLVLGLADGTVQVALNNNTEIDPLFASPTAVQVGLPGAKAGIDVGSRATPEIVDWNEDGRYDLVVGGLDGKVHVFLDTALTGLPDLQSDLVVQDGTGDLAVPSGRSSVAVADLNGDGKKDLLLGNTEGQLVFYANRGADESPQFAGYELLWVNDAVIDLPDTPRSRPFVTDYNEDGIADVLMGAADGYVRLYRGTEDAGPGVGDPGGAFRYVFAVQATTTPNPWQNSTDRLDVNGDQKITALDALIIINRLNGHGPGPLPIPPADAFQPPPQYDCSGNGELTALDALLVINELNRRGPYDLGGG
jgi:hypothetical protein